MEISYLNNHDYNNDLIIDFFKEYNININIENIDIPNIDSNQIEDNLNYKTKFMSDVLKKDVLAIDIFIEIPSLNNFPGTKTNYVLDTIGIDGIKLLLNNELDKTINIKETLSFTKYNEEPIVFNKIYSAKLEDDLIVLEKENITNNLKLNNIKDTKLFKKLILYLYKID
ncbi:MAG: hypothetical protein PHQ64_02290 [Bacilli bacterium]|nr:hypothetical protein [Bacilli bacterium]